jgi:hypothetical protein
MSRMTGAAVIVCLRRSVPVASLLHGGEGLQIEHKGHHELG